MRLCRMWHTDKLFNLSIPCLLLFYPLFCVGNACHTAQNDGRTVQNAGWTAQNEGQTAQYDSGTTQNDGRNTLNVCQGPNGGLEEPPRAPGDPPLPLYLKKL